ncbi:hypothetical protein [Flavobacterium hercynium]|uniref:Uncharacterized protein n=1 Tax=Flavobacterium hercynium TaxID=387094 RepID=A0A226HPR4_9FLAO|nr:hypothetical protein [Flavobacterium hercynium]OXA95888.1 hypothetical protein B0A66_01960 [Flavobacterium hercynium]SMP34065.1 hypothetical protein SAMN06265346_11785 [Flavobacterium hercynium]
MIAEYEILTQVEFKHRYFLNNKLECFTIQPDHNTNAFFLKSGIVFKAFNNGFKLLFASFQNQEKKDRSSVLEDFVLRFQITLNDPYFFNYTDCGAKKWDSGLYHFNNFGKKEERFGIENLHKEEFVSNEDTVDESTFGQKFLRKPFGIIELQLRYDLQTAYVVHFREIESYWRYIIVGDHFKNLAQLAIIGKDVAFEGPGNITLPDNREGISFVSLSPIGHKQRPDQYFKLVDHYTEEESAYTILIKALPVPDTKHISSIIANKNDNKYYSEIFIY